MRSLVWHCEARQVSLREGKNPYRGFVLFGQRFSVAVRESIRRRRDLSPKCIFFTYDTGALETLEFLRDREVRSIVGQMDPNRVEVELVRQESLRWPGWESEKLEVPEEYLNRREREWALADRVVVNSDYCRRALLQQGVPSSKLVVIPLCYELEKCGRKPEKERRESAPLRVLFLGQVVLRKGIQYLIEAARLLDKENVRFDIVGPVKISTEVVKNAPGNVFFHGRAIGDQVSKWYASSDVFVLPTISDGFALTQIEAMAHGLPVVATRNCGEVVTDGRDGFIVPLRDPMALASALLKYATDEQLLLEHGKAAESKASQFSLGALQAKLLRLQADLTGGRPNLTVVQ